MLRTGSKPRFVRGRRATFDQVIQRAQDLQSARRRFARPETVHLDHLRREVEASLDEASSLDDVLGQCAAWLECREGGLPDRAHQCLVTCAVALHLERLPPDHAWSDAQRLRCAALKAQTWLPPLDVDLICRLPLGDADAVLRLALQQAADSPDCDDHLLPLATLFVQLQGEERPQVWGLAWALRDGLLQVLGQWQVSPMDAVALSRRAWIEQRLDEGWVGRFGRALRIGDLPAAVVCVQHVQALNEALAVAMATDLMQVVKQALAQAGLTVEWTAIKTTPVLEDRTGDPPRRFVAVLRAWSVLRCLDMPPSRPLALSCERWLRGHLLTDEARPAVLGLLSGAHGDPALPPTLMDLFEQAMCSPGARAADVEWLILRYAERIDLADVLAPIRAPVDPKMPPVSGFDRLCALARKLADPASRQRAAKACQDAWRPGWAVLLGLSQHLFERAGETIVMGEENLVQPHIHMHIYLRRQRKRPSVPGVCALFDSLWLCSAANGLCSPFDGLVLLTCGLDESPVSHGELLPFWTPGVWESLFARLAPYAAKGMSESQRQALLRRNLMGILLRSTPRAVSSAVHLAGRQRFAQGAAWATASVLACQQWADERRQGQAWPFEELARLWRHYAIEDPDWLVSTRTSHPWVGMAVDLLDDIEKQGDLVGKAGPVVARALSKQLIKKS